MGTEKSETKPAPLTNQISGNSVIIAHTLGVRGSEDPDNYQEETQKLYFSCGYKFKSTLLFQELKNLTVKRENKAFNSLFNKCTAHAHRLFNSGITYRT